MPMQGGGLYHFYDGLWYHPAEAWTCDLPDEASLRQLDLNKNQANFKDFSKPNFVPPPQEYFNFTRSDFNT